MQRKERIEKRIDFFKATTVLFKQKKKDSSSFKTQEQVFASCMNQFTSKQQEAQSRIALGLHVLLLLFLLQQWHRNPNQTTAKHTANNTNYYTRFIIFLF